MVYRQSLLGMVYRHRFHWGWCTDRDSTGDGVQTEIPLGMVYRDSAGDGVQA